MKNCRLLFLLLLLLLTLHNIGLYFIRNWKIGQPKLCLCYYAKEYFTIYHKSLIISSQMAKECFLVGSFSHSPTRAEERWDCLGSMGPGKLWKSTVFLLAGFGARAVFSAVDLAGASFECCRCSKVVSHLEDWHQKQIVGITFYLIHLSHCSSFMYWKLDSTRQNCAVWI